MDVGCAGISISRFKLGLYSNMLATPFIALALVATSSSVVAQDIIINPIQIGQISEAWCSTGDARSCVGGAMVGVFSYYFSAFKVWDKRDVHPTVLSEFPALNGCGTPCRLDKELPEGDWHRVGNVSTSEFFHQIDYKRSDGVSTLRATQLASNPSSSRAKRDSYDLDGIVATYNWGSPDADPSNDGEEEQAWDAFGSDPYEISQFAADVTAALYTANCILACTVFVDYVGSLGNGLTSIGWNDAAYDFGTNGFGGYLSDCGL